MNKTKGPKGTKFREGDSSDRKQAWDTGSKK